MFDQNSSINPAPGSFNDDSLVRGIISASIKACGKSREQIADEMTVLLGVSVTARMVTSFTAESKELHRWPAAWDRAFCHATGDMRLLRCRVEREGLFVVGKTEIELLNLGREFLRQKRASQQVELLEQRLRGVEL